MTRMLLTRHGDGTVLVVGHAEVNKAVLSQAKYSDVNGRHRIDQGNACLNELQYRGDGKWCAKT